MSDTTPEVTPAETTIVPETPVVLETPNTEVTTPAETPKTEPTSEVTEPTVDVLEGMSEEDLVAAIAEAMKPKDPATPTEPVNFPAKEETKVETDIDKLQKEVELEAQLEAMKDELSKKEQSSQLIENTWSAFVNAIPDMQTMLEGFVKKGDDGAISYDESAIPAHFKAENRKRVIEHPIIGPLVTAIERGEELDIPGFVKALTASRKNALPRTSTADREVTPAPDQQASSPASLLTKNKRTISLT